MALKGLYVEQAGTQSLNNFPLAYKPGTAEWSQSAWVWLDTRVADNYGMGIAGLHNDNDTGTSERTLAIYGVPSRGPVLRSYTYDTGIRTNETITTVPIGRWVHVGVSAVANGRHVLWLDGKPSRYATGGGFFTGYGTVRASLSGTQIGSGSTNAQSPRQRIADVAMWDVALSDEDMLALATKQARPTQIQYGRCFAFFPLNRSFINLRSPERGSPNLAELANFRLDQQSPFEGLPGLNLYGALGLSARRVAPAAATGVTGTLSATLGALTSAATGTVQVRGASTQTLGALTSASSGTVAVVGSSSNTLGALTSTSAGTVAVVGTASNTLGALTLSSAGTTATGPVGTLSATLGSLTSSAAGTVQVRGTSTQTLGELTSASAGAVRVAGSLSATLGALTLAGGDLNASTGGLSATLDGLTVVAVGTAPLVWTVQTPANASWAAQSSSGSWVVQSVTASSWVLVA